MAANSTSTFPRYGLSASAHENNVAPVVHVSSMSNTVRCPRRDSSSSNARRSFPIEKAPRTLPAFESTPTFVCEFV